MTEKIRIPTHPGIILKEEFMNSESKISITEICKRTNISVAYLRRFVKGSEEITTNVAIRLAKVFNTSPDFWMNLNTQHYTAKLLSDKGYSERLNSIKPFNFIQN
jgi:addiction module HigA family antidote